MSARILGCTPVLIGLILFFSLVSLVVNHFVYQFPGNNYFPDNAFVSILSLSLIYLGLILSLGNKSRLTLRGKELLHFFGVMSIIAIASNAIQLTPFPTIDHHILTLERWLQIDLISIRRWTHQYPVFESLLVLIYDSLPYQMSIIPFLLIGLGRFNRMHDYYFLLLSTTLIGFLIYYFFPTTAPASVLTSPLFSNEQLATGLKFNQIHHHISPTTNEGGLIALPSFHVIWALLCVYLVQEWKLLCSVLAVFNALLIASCVLLGWHYPIDVLAGVLLLIICFYLKKLCSRDLTYLTN